MDSVVYGVRLQLFVYSSCTGNTIEFSQARDDGIGVFFGNVQVHKGEPHVAKIFNIIMNTEVCLSMVEECNTNVVNHGLVYAVGELEIIF